MNGCSHSKVCSAIDLMTDWVHSVCHVYFAEGDLDPVQTEKESLSNMKDVSNASTSFPNSRIQLLNIWIQSHH